MYSGGAYIPDGNYCVFFDVLMHQGMDKNNQPKGPARLGVMGTFYPLANPTEEGKLTQFYSMGSKADQSFAPNPETGKGIVPIPGAAGTNLNDKTNWSMLHESLIQSGLPEGIFTNDISTIDGIFVHITNIDEPAERAGFASATAEVAQEQRKPGKVAVVTEILDGGSPWEGGGGLDAAVALLAATPASAKPGARPVAARPVVARPVAVPAGRPAAARPVVVAPPVVEDAPVEADEAIHTAALNGVYAVLTAKPLGLPRAALRTDTFSAVKKETKDEAMATAVIDSYFEPGREADLAALLAEMNFAVVGSMVKPVA